MTPRLGALAAALAAGAVALAGCGGGGGDSGSVTTVQSHGAPRVTLADASGGTFDPQAIYQEAAPGVVTIRSIFSGGGLQSLLGGGSGAAQGSGFVISDGGEIATNAHVVTDATGSGGGPIHEAKEVYVQFADRNEVSAHIVGFDPNADVALLTVDPDGLDLRPLKLATNEEVRVGQPVAAIGSPFGEDRSLSAGIVSATDRSIQSLTRFEIEGAIQTDASINPGNSGGPLLDADGNVIGINQQINTTSGGNEGVGFAVPIALVARSLADLRSGGPADQAGLRGSDQKIRFQGQEIDAGGDVIVAVDDHKVVKASDLPEIIARYTPGDTVTLRIIRDGDTQNVDVKLGERPASGG